jgi:hypothetical protein
MTPDHFTSATVAYRKVGVEFKAIAEKADHAKTIAVGAMKYATEIRSLLDHAQSAKKDGMVKTVEELIGKVKVLDPANQEALDLKAWVDSLSHQLDLAVKKKGSVGERISFKLTHVNVSQVAIDFGDHTGLIKPDLKTVTRITHTYGKATDYTITVTAVDRRGDPVERRFSIHIEPASGGIGLIWLIALLLVGGGAIGLRKVLHPRPKMTLTFVLSESGESREVAVTAREVRRLNDDGLIQFPHDLHIRYKSGRADGTNQDGYQLKSAEDLWWGISGSAAERQRLTQEWGYAFAFSTKYEIFHSELSTQSVGCVEVNEIR